jgi:hypothetical protein
VSGCEHRFEQRQGRGSVIAKINLRVLHALPGFDQRRKVHHSVEAPSVKRGLKQRAVGDITFHKLSFGRRG